jgi:hypothetical protein
LGFFQALCGFSSFPVGLLGVSFLVAEKTERDWNDVILPLFLVLLFLAQGGGEITSSYVIHSACLSFMYFARHFCGTHSQTKQLHHLCAPYQRASTNHVFPATTIETSFASAFADQRFGGLVWGFLSSLLFSFNREKEKTRLDLIWITRCCHLCAD